MHQLRQRETPAALCGPLSKGSAGSVEFSQQDGSFSHGCLLIISLSSRYYDVKTRFSV